jgi:hypothetical protein
MLCLCVALGDGQERLAAEPKAEISSSQTMVADWLASALRLAKANGSVGSVGDAQEHAAIE